MKNLQKRLHQEITNNILPFWLSVARDHAHGGCIGEMSSQGVVNVKADKSVILHARILWSCSESYRVFRTEAYLQEAHYYFDFLMENFTDQEHQGVYTDIKYDSSSFDNVNKSIVAQAYVIYALSAYFNASGNKAALTYAKQLMALIEACAKDSETGRYYADVSQNWEKLPKQASSVSPSTYLHLIEAYTSLLTCEPDQKLRDTLYNVVHFFVDHVIDKECRHVKQNFSLEGGVTITGKRYGHDCEAAWLLVEAAKVIENAPLLKKCDVIALSLIEQVVEEHQTSVDAHLQGITWGINSQAGEDDNAETSRVAWVQAEALGALSWAYDKTQMPHYKEWLLGTWYYIENFIVDGKQNDWLECRYANGVLAPNNLKIGPWKCPYHSVRGCLNFLTLLNHEQYNQAFSQAYANSFQLDKNNKEAS